MANPLISVVMPARNEKDRVGDTIRSFAENRSTHFELEVVVVDDASEDGCCSNLVYQARRLAYPGLSIRVFRFEERLGVPRARNRGAAMARGDILFITDSHIRVSPDWDGQIFRHLRGNRVLAATVSDPGSGFKGFGCTLVVPFMGTHWVRAVPNEATPVQIAACSGTVLRRDLFHAIGGYDAGMMYYSAAEPEFSVRAWLSGAEIICVPALEVQHRFKPKPERAEFLNGLRPYMIHNSLRFGMLYLSELAILQMLRYYSLHSPSQIQKALQLLEASDVWQRRSDLRTRLSRDFDWFVRRFEVRDHINRHLLS